jgi:drug/metabolite transporter (DMT)-like permease
VAASTYSAFAKSLSNVLSPLSLFFVSEVVLLMGIFFSFGFMPTIKKLLYLKRSMLAPLLFIGLTSGTLGPLLLYSGLESTTAVNASLFGNAEMAFLIILAVVLLHERFTVVHAFSVVAISTGMLIIALEGFTIGLHFRMGDVLIIIAGLVYAIGSITYRRALHHCDPEIPLVARSCIALTCFFLLSPFIDHTLAAELSVFPLALIPALLGFGLISRLLNVFSFYEAIDRLRVTTVSLLCNLGIITSALFAHWFLGEPIYSYHIAGGLLIVMGTVILEFAGMHKTWKLHWFHLHQRQVQRL